MGKCKKPKCREMQKKINALLKQKMKLQRKIIDLQETAIKSRLFLSLN